MNVSPDEMQAALPPTASLLSKSEKAIGKLTPGTWQHSMLIENIAALKLAALLLEDDTQNAVAITKDGLSSSIAAIDSMIQKTEKVLEKFLLGTSQHSMSRNRLNALRIATNVFRRRLKS